MLKTYLKIKRFVIPTKNLAKCFIYAIQLYTHFNLNINLRNRLDAATYKNQKVILQVANYRSFNYSNRKIYEESFLNLIKKKTGKTMSIFDVKMQ